MAAWRIRGVLTLKWPVSYGCPRLFDDYEKLLHTLFYHELRVAPEEHAVVQVLHPHALSDQPAFERIIHLTFETFNIPRFLPLPSDVAVLYALSAKEGRDCMTGVVVSVGASVVVSCVDQGSTVEGSVVVRKWGGWDLKDELARRLDAAGISAKHEFVEEVKEKLCFVAPYSYAAFERDYAEHPELVDRSVPASAEDPSQLKTVGRDLFEPAEALFAGEQGLHRMVAESLSRCQAGVAGRLRRLVLDGRASLLPGLAERLGEELKTLGLGALRVVALPQRGDLAWAGAAAWVRRAATCARQPGGGQGERRIDPEDGQVCTLDEAVAKYSGSYSEDSILDWWLGEAVVFDRTPWAIDMAEYDEVGPTVPHRKARLLDVPQPFCPARASPDRRGPRAPSSLEQFDEARFLCELRRAVASARLLFAPEAALQLPSEEPLPFAEQFAHMEAIVGLATGGSLNCLGALGLVDTICEHLLGSACGCHQTLRAIAVEGCTFLREVATDKSEDRRMVDPSTGKHGMVPMPLIDKVWRVVLDCKVLAFAGPSAEDAVELMAVHWEKEVQQDARRSAPAPERTQTGPLDVDISWLLRQRGRTFAIDLQSARTPRRNAQVEEALVAVAALHRWSSEVLRLFAPKVEETASSIFAPVIPLLTRSGADQPWRSPGLEALLREHRRTLQSRLSELSALEPAQQAAQAARSEAATTECASGDAPAAPCAAIGIAGAVAVLRSLLLIAQRFSDTLDFFERSLRNKIIGAIGQEVSGEDFAALGRFRLRRLLRPGFRPGPLSYSVRRGALHDPDGTLSIEVAHAGGTSEPIDVLTYASPGGEAMRFPIGAATNVAFQGPRYLHGWLSHDFPGEDAPLARVSARARRFGGFVLVLGVVAGPNLLEPREAIIVSDQDSLDIPLDVEAIPSPKEFADAIASLSPEQQRFCQAFRQMQLASTVFGICAIQIRPQMERVLRLPPGCLPKEPALAQDLMSLFVDYQLPSDLIAFGGEAAASAAERVSSVKAHVRDLKEMCRAMSDPDSSPSRTRLSSAMERLGRERAAIASAGPLLPEVEPFDDGTEESAPPIVLDVGSVMSKAGFCDDIAPRVRSMSVVGRPKMPGIMVGMDQKDAYSGGDAPVSNALGGGSEAAETAAAAEAPPEAPRAAPDGGGEARKRAAGPAQRDLSAVPHTLDACFARLDPEGAVRPCIVRPAATWHRRRREGAGTASEDLDCGALAVERNRAFDLLDALTLSGGLAIEEGAELHVLLASRHCFLKSVMDTLVHDSRNPMAHAERSGLILASVIHERRPEALLADGELGPCCLPVDAP